MLMPIAERLSNARRAYVSGDFARAKTLLDEVIGEAKDSPYGVAARYLRARGYEDGAFSGQPDLQKAYEDFLVVKSHLNECGSNGSLGCARILYRQDAIANKKEIFALCMEAIDRDSNVKAMMLLGSVYENAEKDGRSARKWYLKAFRCGLPWGMRFFARSHAREGNYVRAALAHALATISSPFLVLVFGARSAF